MKIFLTILLLSSLHVSGTKYYFAAAGNDANATNTIGTPWQSITKLNTIIASLSPGDSVFFNRGDVFDGALSAPASGNSSARIFIGAYGTGAKPVLNGFQSIVSWSNLGGGIWEGSVNSGLSLNLVLLNGQPVTQGRTPNTGSYNRVKYSGIAGDMFAGFTGYIKSPSLNAATLNYTGAELVVRSTVYTLDRNFITSASDSTLNFNSQSSHKADSANGYFIQNHPSTLDGQNEWFYNSTAHTLRMFSSSNPSSIGTGVLAAVYDMGVSRDPISYIHFDNLTFRGYDSIAIRFRTSSRLKVSNCAFDQIGCNGIYIDTGTRDTISNNTFTNIYNTGIYITYSTYPVVTGNDINGCGLVEGMGQGNNQAMDGILLVNTSDSPVVKNNIVQNVGYCGITFDGNNAVIKNNHINWFGRTLSDGGGIYTCCNFGVGVGARIIESNIVENGFGDCRSCKDTVHGGQPPIYLDDNTGSTTIKNNTCKNGTRAGIFLHNTVSINVFDNTIYAGNGEIGLILEDDGLGNELRNTVVRGNRIYTLSGVSAVQLRSDLNDYGSMGIINDNIYARSAAGNLFNIIGATTASYTLNTWRSTFGYDQSTNFITVNPDSVRLEFAVAPKYVLLNNTYSDFRGSAYYQYVPIPAYGSLLLYRKTYPSIKTSRRIKFTQ